MKNLLLPLFFIGGFIQVNAQHTTIVENAQKSQYENTSYLVTGTLTLKPGFNFNSSQQGTFFARAYDNDPSRAPTEDRNFIRSEAVFKEGIITDDQVIALETGDKLTSFSYSDGMGRGIQSIQVQASSTLMDVVQPSYYDSKNRPSRSYLPYRSDNSTGAYREAALTEQNLFYNSPPAGIPADNKAYATTIFEDSPLERVLSSTNVGNAFQAKTVTDRFKVNEAGTVRKWTIANGLPASMATYAAGALGIEESKNVEGALTKVYKDFAGRTVLTQVQSANAIWLNTYYVYNDYGELLFTIPPEASAAYTPSQAYADLWYFQYEYDDLGRQIASKAPGAGWAYTVYDRWDRPVLTQDAGNRERNSREWNFAKYDIHNRLVVSGIFIASVDIGPLRTDVTNSTDLREEIRNTSAIGYTLDRTYPANATAGQVLAITYYDDYGFLANAGWDPEGKDFSYGNPSGFTNTRTTGTVKGLATGSKSRTTASTVKWHHSVTYYDKYYQPVQTVSGHQLAGTIRVTTQYAFSGEVLKTQNAYTGTGGAQTIERRYTYDHAGRPLRIYHKLNSNDEVLLSEMAYNELGQPITTQHHSRDDGSSYLYGTAFQYTLQGWLKQKEYSYPGSGGAIFTEQLAYNNALGTANAARYDGTASGVRWKHAEGVGDQAYNYAYDMAGRMTGAVYKQKDNGTSAWLGNNLYNEEGITYSPNGNIKTLTRNKVKSSAAATIDQLAYSYSGNRLTAVTDNATATQKPDGFKDGNTATSDYTYNNAGNLTADKNKGITSITYDVLDLPQRVTFGNGSYIDYTYDAGGVRIREVRSISGSPAVTIDYVGELVFEDNVLMSVYHEAGKIDAASFRYQYYLTDHLGSTRAVLQEDPPQYTSTATFEETSMTMESQQFIGYEETTRLAEPLFDHTDTKDSRYAARLSGGAGENIGLAKSVSVLPGDTVRMEVFGKYLDLNKGKSQPVLMALATSMAGGGAAQGVDGGAVAAAANASNKTHPFAGMLGSKNNQGKAPPAYLNYLFFDKERTFKHGGFVQMGEGAREDGTDVSHERLYQEVVADEPGYYYIYLSNDSPTGSEAFFDDFSVQVAEGPVIQMTDYYPYGLIAENWVREGEQATKELFQGKTFDEETGWNDFHARQYDPALGRWFATDPQNQFASPYLAMGNNPVMMVDPDGEAAFLIPLAAAIIGGGLNVWSNADNIRDWKSGLAYFTSGAIGGVVSVGNPFLGGYLTSVGNIGIDVATGNMPEFNRPTDLLMYTGVKALEGLSAGSAGSLAKGGARLLGKAGWIQYGSGSNAPLALMSSKLGLKGGVKVSEFIVTAVNIPGSSFAKVGAGKAGSLAAKGNNFLRGGKTFSQYKASYWSGRAKPTLDPIINPNTGQVWKQYTELHHRFIPQRANWAPNWLKNNRLNLTPASSLRHAQMDPYRARFAPNWIKEMYNLKWK